MTSPTPRHRRPTVAEQPPPPAFDIADPGRHRHDQLVSVPSMATTEEQRRAEEQDIDIDRRRERWLLLKAFLALAVVGGIAVAHSLYLG